jgi:hypothetical protein
MADLFSQNGKNGGRGLERVSHFFLSDSSLPESRQKTEVSDCPGDADTSFPLPHGKATPRIRDNEDAVAAPPSNLCIILSPDGLISQSAFLGCMLALSLAGDDVPVGLIETTVRLPHTFFLSGGYKNVNAFFWEADIDAPEFLSMVGRIQKACDVVFLNVTFSVFSGLAGSSLPIGKCLVPTSVDSEDLINTYSVIKSVSQKRVEEEIDLVVFQESPTDNATGAAMVMEKMARRFLSCSIRFLGAIPIAEDMMPARTDLSLSSFKGWPQTVTASINEIAHNIIRADDRR